MTTPYTFELNSFDITVQDPASVESWVKGLMPLIEDLASDNGVTQFQRWDDISADSQKKIGIALHHAMKNYRNKSEGVRPFQDYFIFALNDEWSDDSQDWYIDNISRKPVDDLYSDIDDIMSEYEGPVAALDDVIDQMFYAMEEKITENDDSTCLDMFSGHSISLTFNPSYDPHDRDVDSVIIYPDTLASHLDSSEVKSMIDFLRLDKKQVLSILGLNFKDTDGIRDVVDELRKIDHDLPPVLASKDLISVFDNVGSSYAYPHWHGEIDFDDLLKIDPNLPLRLQGGVIALVDVVNGAGDYVSLPDDSVVVISPTQYPSPKYWSYGCQEVFGGCRTYEATIKPFNLEIYKAVEAERNQRLKLGLEDLTLG